MYKDVLVPFDRSIINDKSILDEAVKITDKQDGTVHGLFVHMKDIEKSIPDDESMSDKPTEHFNSYFESKEVKHKTSEVTGNIVESIDDYVKSQNIEVVAMRKNRKSKIRELIIGSTTNKTIESVDCPVLVLEKE